MKRKITVSLEIEFMETAASIWDAHINNQLIMGCKVLGIREGRLSEIIEEEFRDHAEDLD